MNEYLQIFKERLDAFDPAFSAPEMRPYLTALAKLLTGGEIAAAWRTYAYCRENAGPSFKVLCCWYEECVKATESGMDFAVEELLETSIRLICAHEEAWAEEKRMPEEPVIRDIVWSYLHDNAALFTEGFLSEAKGAGRLFMRCDPAFGCPENDKEHGSDLALFWGDRLRAAKLEALSLRKTRPDPLPPVRLQPVFPERTSADSPVFSERQKNSIADYARKASEILHEIQ